MSKLHIQPSSFSATQKVYFVLQKTKNKTEKNFATLSGMGGRKKASRDLQLYSELNQTIIFRAKLSSEFSEELNPTALTKLNISW